MRFYCFGGTSYRNEQRNATAAKFVAFSGYFSAFGIGTILRLEQPPGNPREFLDKKPP